MRIAINGNRHQEGHFHDIDRLVTAFVSRGDTVVMADRFLEYLTQHLGSRFETGLEYQPLYRTPQADLAIAVGGDGAFLKTARWIGSTGIPVAGINTGHLGYLSAFSFDRPEEIERCLLGTYRAISPRSVIELTLPDGHKEYALNEAAVSRGDYASMVAIDVAINGQPALSYLGDGLIVATPTGSTAYNLSVGGPILDPSLDGFVISPVAPHSLTARPLVVADTALLELDVSLRANGFRLNMDGRPMTVATSSRLLLKKAPFMVNVVHAPGVSFTDTLRAKFMNE